MTKHFLFVTASRPTLNPIQPPIRWVPGDLFLEVKQLEREANPSLSSSTEVKNAWSCTSTPPRVFMQWYLAKPRNKSTHNLISSFRSSPHLARCSSHLVVVVYLLFPAGLLCNKFSA